MHLRRANMASTINVTLTGVSDQIAAAVADSLEPHRITDKAPEASNIGEELGKSVANALNTALAKIKSSALSASFLREQILGMSHVPRDKFPTDVTSQFRCHIRSIQRQRQG